MTSTHVAKTLTLAISVVALLAACDSNETSSASTCRANLGAIEIVEVWGNGDTLHIAGRLLHHCATPSVMTVRFIFLDASGATLAIKDAKPLDGEALPAVTPEEFEWTTPMIEGVDAITAMVVRLAEPPPSPAN